MTAMMIDAALRGLVLAAMVGAGLRLLRVTNVPVRKAAWTLVLVASTAMPFLMQWSRVTGLAARFGWGVPIHRSEAAAVRPAVLPAPVVMSPAPVERAGSLDTVAPTPTAASAPKTDRAPSPAAISSPVVALNPVITLSPGPTEPLAPRRTWEWPPVERLIRMVYLAVCGVLLLRLLWGLGAAWWIWARAEEVSPLVAPEPNVRVSRKVPSPVTIGSAIVLPANYAEWGRAKLRVVLAHERSHVRQMDFYWQLLTGVYAAFFWFSPLGWWLKRTLSALSESISDRAGMEVAPSRSEYAGVLLEFAAMPRRALPGVAMARSGNLSRRVEGLLNENLFRRAFAEGRRRAAISLLLVPAALFAVTALVRVPNAAAQTGPPPQTTVAQNPASQNATPPNTTGAATTPLQDQSAPPVTGQSNPPENQVSATGADEGQNPAAPPAPQAPPAAEASQDGMQMPQPAVAPQAAPAPPPVNPGEPAPEAFHDAEGPVTLDVGPTPEVWMKVRKMPDMKLVMPKIPDVPVGTRMLNMMAGGWGNNLSLTGPNESFYLTPNGGIHGYAYYFSSNGDSWALVDGPGKHFSVGDGATKDQLDLAQRMAKGPFLWFSHDGKSYMVDDPAIVARIQALYAPMKGVGPREEALAVQQRVLGKIEAELARSQREQANVRVPDLSKEMADAKAALDSLQSEQGQMLSEQKLADMQSKLAEMEARLGSLEANGAMESNFGQRMRALGDQQRQLGEQQRQLGEQEKKLAEQAEQQVQNIIQQSLQNGKAMQLK